MSRQSKNLNQNQTTDFIFISINIIIIANLLNKNKFQPF